MLSLGQNELICFLETKICVSNIVFYWGLSLGNQVMKSLLSFLAGLVIQVICHFVSCYNKFSLTEIFDVDFASLAFKRIFINFQWVTKSRLALQSFAIFFFFFFRTVAELTLNMQGLSYPSLTRSVSWLLMSWLFVSPGHQHLWYWLCRIDKFLSSIRKDFNYLSYISTEEW